MSELKAKSPSEILKEFQRFQTPEALESKWISNLDGTETLKNALILEKGNKWLKSALASLILWAESELDNKCGDCNGGSEIRSQLYEIAKKISE